MGSLVLASVGFILIHIGISGTKLRDALVARIGDRSYLGLFSLLSIGLIVWMSRAYAAAPELEVWGTSDALRAVALVVVLVAFLFVLCGLTTPNPTSVGGEALLEHPQSAARGILRITRHPFLCGVALWSGMHLLVKGDWASLVFFGSLAAVALIGPSSIDRRRARLAGVGWPQFAAVTSVVPFVAIAQGRTRLALGEIGWWRLLLGIAVYGAFLYFHSTLFGVSALPE